MSHTTEGIDDICQGTLVPREVHGLVSLLYKGGGSTDRTCDYRPVVLLNRLFQIVSYIIQERLVRIVEGSNILEPGQGPFVRIDLNFENVFNFVPHENLWTVLRASKYQTSTSWRQFTR